MSDEIHPDRYKNVRDPKTREDLKRLDNIFDLLGWDEPSSEDEDNESDNNESDSNDSDDSDGGENDEDEDDDQNNGNEEENNQAPERQNPHNAPNADADCLNHFNVEIDATSHSPPPSPASRGFKRFAEWFKKYITYLELLQKSEPPVIVDKIQFTMKLFDTQGECKNNKVLFELNINDEKIKTALKGNCEALEKFASEKMGEQWSENFVCNYHAVGPVFETSFMEKFEREKPLEDLVRAVEAGLKNEEETLKKDQKALEKKKRKIDRFKNEAQTPGERKSKSRKTGA